MDFHLYNWWGKRNPNKHGICKSADVLACKKTVYHKTVPSQQHSEMQHLEDFLLQPKMNTSYMEYT